MFFEFLTTFWFLGILWLYRFRLPLGIAAGLVLYGMTMRVFSAAYIDFNGPVYAEELDRAIGPAGAATLLFGLIVTILPMVWIWRPTALKHAFRPIYQSRIDGFLTLGDLAFWTGLVIVAALYIEMLLGGVVPLIDCMERTEYLIKHAGALSRLLSEHGAMLALNLGVLTVYPRLRGGKYDQRPAIILFAILMYGLLTGHRVSMFVVYSFFFILPFSLIAVSNLCNGIPTNFVNPLSRLSSGFTYHKLIFAVVMLGVLILVGLGNSYIRVRGECELSSQHNYLAQPPLQSEMAPSAYFEKWGSNRSNEIRSKLLQRLGVQQAQMWFPTWERVFAGGAWNPNEAWDAMFLNPIIPERNSGIQYVMLKELGEDRAAELLGKGQQYVSGHTEIVFELFGPWAGWPILILIGAVFGWLLRVWATAVWEGRFLTAFTAGYICYALILLILGGMPNFLVAWTFWVKVAFFCMAYFFERTALHRGRPLVSYVLRPVSADLREAN